jgi:hypothetical protein
MTTADNDKAFLYKTQTGWNNNKKRTASKLHVVVSPLPSKPH